MVFCVLQEEIINDFIIPSKDKETARRHRGRHLEIEYHMDRIKYTIRDLGVGFGAFAKLDNPFVCDIFYELIVARS